MLKFKSKKKDTSEKPKRKFSTGKILFSLTLAIITYFILISIESGILDKYEKIEVVMSLTNIEEGTEITEDNVSDLFGMKEVNASLKLENGVEKVEDLVGYIAQENIVSNEIMHLGSFINKKEALQGIEEPTNVSISVSNINNAVAGTLRKGDFIDISVILSETGENVKLFNHIYIQEAYDSSGVTVDRGSDTPTIMLLITVDKEDLEWLYEMTAKGEIKINTSKYADYEALSLFDQIDTTTEDEADKEKGKETKQQTDENTQIEDAVYVSENDNEYHTAECEKTNEDSIAIAFSDAKNQGYTPHTECID